MGLTFLSPMAKVGKTMPDRQDAHDHSSTMIESKCLGAGAGRPASPPVLFTQELKAIRVSPRSASFFISSQQPNFESEHTLVDCCLCLRAN